jgi:hypothetical protein
MKNIILVIAVFLSFSVAAKEADYELSFQIKDAQGVTVVREKFDASGWLDAFPNPGNSRGAIEKKFSGSGIEARVGYYRASSDANPAKSGHRLNIYDLSVRSAAGKSLCYNSFYVVDLRETPYIHQTCPTPEGGHVSVDFQAKKYW